MKEQSIIDVVRFIFMRILPSPRIVDAVGLRHWGEGGKHHSRQCHPYTSRGFTLIEVIVTLVISSILGAMLVQFMGTNLTGSIKPVLRTQDTLALQQVMENIVIDYNKLMVTDSAPLATLRTHIETNSEGYGSYSIVTNTYVTYDNDTGTEMAGGTGILKVTISHGDFRLTALFAQ